MSTISFTLRGKEHELEDGQQVLVRAVLDAQDRVLPVRPFLARVVALATPGRWFYAQRGPVSYCVPWDSYAPAKSLDLSVGEAQVWRDGATLHVKLRERAGHYDWGIFDLFEEMMRSKRGTTRQFHLRNREAQFLEEQLQEHKRWDAIVFHQSFMSGGEHTLKTPGPFEIKVFRNSSSSHDNKLCFAVTRPR